MTLFLYLVPALFELPHVVERSGLAGAEAGFCLLPTRDELPIPPGALPARPRRGVRRRRGGSPWC